ncbi:cyclic nucleotide-binding domain-containing protein [Thermodesulfobacteriota bacterium]
MSSVLSGNIKFLSLGDVLQLLGQNSSTGVLQLNSKYAQEPGLVYLADGNPVDASAGSLIGLDALNSLFGWLDGEFEFSEKDVNRENVVKKSRMEIILDGLSLLDDGAIEVLGPVSYEKKSSDAADRATSLPVIRGPLVDYMYVVDEEEYYDGSKITVEGKHGSWIWVVLEGIVDIVLTTTKEPLTLLRVSEGGFVGSIASFTMGKYVRSSTVMASGSVQLGVLDSQRLSTEFSAMASDLRGLMISLDRRLKQVTSRIVEITENQNRVQEFVKDKKLFIKQGAEQEKLFSITQGEAYIVRQTDKIHVPLAKLGKGDFFGQVPFLDIGHEPYSASVLGTEDLEVTEMDPEKLESAYQQLSPTFKNMIDHLVTSLSVTTALAGDTYKKAERKKQKQS